MAKYIVDTNILIYFLRGNKKYVTYLRNFDDRGDIYCSLLTKFEIYIGMRETEKKSTIEFLDAIDDIGINKEITMKAYEYYKEYNKINGLNIIDAFISATAYNSNLILLTTDTHFIMKDFEIYIL